MGIYMPVAILKNNALLCHAVERNCFEVSAVCKIVRNHVNVGSVVHGDVSLKVMMKRARGDEKELLQMWEDVCRFEEKRRELINRGGSDSNNCD